MKKRLLQILSLAILTGGIWAGLGLSSINSNKTLPSSQVQKEKSIDIVHRLRSGPRLGERQKKDEKGEKQ